MSSAVVEELIESTDSELDELIRVTELERRAIEAKLAAAIAVADARGLGQADGHRSTRAYLKATLDWSDRECRRFRGAARTIDEHPEIGDAWLEGRLGGAHLDELSRVRTHRATAERFGEFVPLFVEQADELSLREFKVVLDRFVCLADADGTLDEREAVERRSVTADASAGELLLAASGGTSLEAEEFTEILRRFEQAEFRADVARHEAALAAGRPAEPFRSGPQRRFDALLAMARAAASKETTVIGSSPLVSVLIDQRTMSWVLAHSGLGGSTDLHGDGIDPFTGLPVSSGALDDLLGDPADFVDRRCETTNGVPLRATDVLRCVLSGEIRRVVLGAKSRVVDLGRASRVFTGAAREAAALLTTTCEHPGCDMPASWCQIDHSTEWHDDGATDQSNAAIECAHHNTDKHRTRRRTRRTPNGRLVTFRADGTALLSVGQSPPRFDVPDLGSPDLGSPDLASPDDWLADSGPPDDADPPHRTDHPPPRGGIGHPRPAIRVTDARPTRPDLNSTGSSRSGETETSSTSNRSGVDVVDGCRQRVDDSPTRHVRDAGRSVEPDHSTRSDRREPIPARDRLRRSTAVLDDQNV
ncbi:MAG: HNH endonuclease signature motif containing protein, partial [Actinomycetota bacterium]